MTSFWSKETVDLGWNTIAPTFVLWPKDIKESRVRGFLFFITYEQTEATIKNTEKYKLGNVKVTSQLLKKRTSIYF